MKQILHIFLKDARRFWPEILISLAVVTGLVFIYPHQWLQEPYRLHRSFGAEFVAGGVMRFLAGALVVLVPLSWWLLISRLIHAERLVGDTQFWLTRPYEWKKLLAAKLLFLLVFLYLPILIAQCLLLGEAGFQPFSYLPGLLYNLFLITGTLVVPLAALSAVTSSFARMTLTLLGVLLSVAAFSAFASILLSQNAQVPDGPLDELSFLLLLCGCVAALVLQYAVRKTWLSRCILAAVPVLLAAFVLTMPEQTMMNSAYPPLAGDAAPPVKISLRPESDDESSAFPADQTKEIRITVPIRVSGVAEGFVVIADNIRASIEAPDGSRWISHWGPEYTTKYMPGDEETSVGFNIPRELYEKYKSEPVRLRIAFALTQGKAGKAVRIGLSTHDFAVPEFGVCSPEIDPFNPLEIEGFVCRSAVRRPRLTYVNVLWTHGPCSSAQALSDSGVLGAAWVGSLDTEPAELGIASVLDVPVSLTNGWASSGQPARQPRFLCQGSAATFTQYDLVGRTQLELVVPDFHIPQLSSLNMILLR